MRIVTARVNHETNTFSPLATPLAAFAPLWGEAALAAGRDSTTALGAFIRFAEARGATVAVPVSAHANPSGPVADAAFEALATAILDAIRPGCDAILLDLHGAMVTESHDDGEGELLARILVTEEPHEPWDLGVFTGSGLDPAAARVLILKSRMYCRPVFEPIARSVVECASRGVTSSDYGLFPFAKLARPVFPLDADATWTPR
jgi:microcystin degradation protein MlrC